MRRWLYNIISVFYSLMKFSLIKLFHFNSFNFQLIERFSPNTSIRFVGRGKIILGSFVTGRSGCKLIVTGKGELYVGNRTKFNHGCIVTAMNSISIGNGVEFGPNVLIYDHDHDFRSDNGFSKNFVKGSVVIGDNCWIGANTVILKNTTIGNNCVIGAGSVISGLYPDNSLIVQKRETTVKKIIILNLD